MRKNSNKRKTEVDKAGAKVAGVKSAGVKVGMGKSRTKANAKINVSLPEQKKKEERPKISRGGRNLIVLGVGSTLIALLTTTIGLAIYHLSGDIYLDRSRPGFLPDEEEVEEEAENEPEEYNFEKSGKLTGEIVDEYLKHLDEEVKAMNAYEKPFDEGALTDERLGIPKEEEKSE